MTHTNIQLQKIQTLLVWADEHGFTEDIFPRDIEALLSLEKLNLTSQKFHIKINFKRLK